MADAEQLAILKQGVDVWNLWKQNNPKAEVNFEGVLLRFNRLNGVDLRGAALRHADLHHADLHDAKLGRADFHSGDLRHADLHHADLHDANLSNANLKRIDLSHADLSHADLRSAHLSYADLSHADLSHADLRSAHLSYANLSGTNLSGADLSETICAYTIFANLDLSNVLGLETIDHRGPSTIGIDTLFRTKPRLSEVFLRGCGVPQILIENLPYIVPTNAIDFYSCFISYSHADKAFARRVHDTLQGQGIRCWLDEKQMNPGDLIAEEIHRGIRYWDKVLLCCSRTSLSKSGWVDFEINKALQKERELRRDREQRVLSLIPLNLDGFLFSSEYEDGIGDEIRSRIAADFTGWERDNAIFEREIERVIKALRTDGGKEPPPKSKL